MCLVLPLKLVSKVLTKIYSQSFDCRKIHYIKFCAVITSFYWWCFLKYLSFCIYGYCDGNICYSNSYQRYSKDIPQVLCDRPQTFVKHCLLEISLAENIDLSGIINTRNFTVVSFSSNYIKNVWIMFWQYILVQCQNVLAMIRVLLWVCCIFSECPFLRASLESYFCLFLSLVNIYIILFKFS